MFRMNNDRPWAWMRGISLVVAFVAMLPGCQEPGPPPYGRELQVSTPGSRQHVWAVAPALNLSGQREVDPLLQADLVYQQMQQVQGLVVVPVNRVAEVYAAMRIAKVESPQQAMQVCELLGCDGLVVPTVTAFDPYDPPKFGGSLQLFLRTPRGEQPAGVEMIQSVGMFDAANGSVRESVLAYAAGRNDPAGPLGAKEYFSSMDRFTGFAYFTLTRDLLREIRETDR